MSHSNTHTLPCFKAAPDIRVFNEGGDLSVTVELLSIKSEMWIMFKKIGEISDRLVESAIKYELKGKSTMKLGDSGTFVNFHGASVIVKCLLPTSESSVLFLQWLKKLEYVSDNTEVQQINRRLDEIVSKIGRKVPMPRSEKQKPAFVVFRCGGAHDDSTIRYFMMSGRSGTMPKNINKIKMNNPAWTLEYEDLECPNAVNLQMRLMELLKPMSTWQYRNSIQLPNHVNVCQFIDRIYVE
ncbi:MAG: hypothetical protein MUO31_07150 [Thermodesulfovibrionales bacterium]|nr:hypothetical protein [Thermodesulfovibrionales bacterium]